MPVSYPQYSTFSDTLSNNPFIRKLKAGQSLTPDDFASVLNGTSGEGSFKGSLTQDNPDRYQQEANRGGAPFTGAGLLAAGENALSVVKGPVAMGVSSMMNVTGMKPKGTWGSVINGLLGTAGIQDIPGYYGIDAATKKRVKSHQDLVEALAAAKKAQIDAATAAYGHSLSVAGAHHEAPKDRGSSASSRAASSGPAGRGAGQMRSGMA